MRFTTSIALSVLAGIVPAVGLAQAPPSTGQAQATGSTNEKLDQLTAPVALYPDALLSQILMASTYPDQVAQAAKWSKEHPDSKGDEAVKKVASQPWDPSVQSLVAFPQALATLAQKPEWVKQLGDAFLARPDAVMDSVQRLRAMAKKSGNLKSNEQQKVEVEQAAPEQTIIKIEPTNPQVVYVPSYNPTVVYGAWPYPAYPPVYVPPPYGYGIATGVATGLAFGIGIGVTSAMWGGFHWGHHDVNVNVNRYNNINTNRQLNANQSSWTKNNQGRIDNARANSSYGRQGQGQGQGLQGAGGGASGNRDAQRARAQDAVQQRQPGAYEGGAADRARGVERSGGLQGAQGFDRGGGMQGAQGFDRGGGMQGAQGFDRGGGMQGAQGFDRGGMQGGQGMQRGGFQGRAGGGGGRRR